MSFTTYIPCICDEEVEVEYRYYKGFAGSFTEPDEPEEVELLSVKWRGMEIIDVLTKKNGQISKPSVLKIWKQKKTRRVKIKPNQWPLTAGVHDDPHH